MGKINFPLDDPQQIFGNDAAEHETESVFTSYAFYRPEVGRFTEAGRPLQVARAYKGEGKSALLRLVEAQLRKLDEPPIIVKATGPSLSPKLETKDSDNWVREWKRKILHRIACEIGSALSVAFSDDAISLVEEAERNGFRARSFVSSITDRLKTKYVPVEHDRPPIADPGRLLQRWIEKGSATWVFIDDIDQNFKNEPLQRLKIATCFIAVSQIFIQIPELRFRLAVRPNVWAIIKMEFEALSHVEQYMVDLPWSEGMFLDLVARRIEAYLARTNQWAEVASGLSANPGDRYLQLQALLFEDPVSWGGRKRSMDVALYTLSRHRPRWLIELCKVASVEAHRRHHNVVLLEDINSQLDAFGTKRIEDMVAEFSSQCAELEQLIYAFSGENERYTTGELLSAIDRRILQQVHPKIVGMSARPTSREIAHFLYQIGFLSARLDSSDGKYEHLAFAERPNLLRVNTNIDEGVSWEVHPVFRSRLKLKDVESKSERSRRGRGK